MDLKDAWTKWSEDRNFGRTETLIAFRAGFEYASIDGDAHKAKNLEMGLLLKQIGWTIVASTFKNSRQQAIFNNYLERIDKIMGTV